jgi:hypothetical protein
LPPETYLELRYETLLAEPEATMRRVCAFLNEPYDAAVLSPSRIPHERGRTARELTSPAFRDGIARDNAGGWKSAMSRRQRALFESVGGRLLGQLGYPVEGFARRLSRGEKTLWEADHQVRFLARTLWRLRKPRFSRAAFSLGWTALRQFLRRPAAPFDNR